MRRLPRPFRETGDGPCAGPLLLLAFSSRHATIGGAASLGAAHLAGEDAGGGDPAVASPNPIGAVTPFHISDGNTSCLWRSCGHSSSQEQHQRRGGLLLANVI